MYYDKRIRYLSYYESGIKLQNAGYVKFQVRDSLCQMIVYMKGPRLMGSGDAKVYLLSENGEKKEEDSFYSGGRKNNLKKHILGNLSIRNGQGCCSVRMDAENMAGSGLRYDQICGIKIELHEYQYLESQWTVTNFMPESGRMRGNAGAGTGGTERGDGRGNNGTGKRAGNTGGGRQRNAGTGRYNNAMDKNRQNNRQGGETDRNMTDMPVEVNLIVTPVSENLRVEKVVKEEPSENIVMKEMIGESAARKTPEGIEVENITADMFRGTAEAADGMPVMQEIPAEEETVVLERVTDKRTPTVDRKTPEQIQPAGRTAAAEMPTMVEAAVVEQTVQISGEEESMQEMLEREIRREEAKGEKSGQTSEGENLYGVAERSDSETEEEIRLAEQELQPDKWEQLKKTYPVVHPIREEEEYLKISPRDFVIFTEKYQELVHNSFLLHGYYNYKHLILGKKEKEGRTVYYLGVPGTFHEREKTVAVMFGFEAFDGKREPAENGDFGYYLRRVEI